MLSILVLLAPAVSADWPPSFCHGIDCPKYTVTGNFGNDSNTLEVRKYPTALWTSTDVKANNEDTALMTGFGRLFSYISGANAKKEKVDMTSPVMCRVKEVGQGPFCNTTFTVSFFVPFKHQEDAPQPTDPSVYLDMVEDREVAVLQGSGYWYQKDVLNYVAKASKILDESDVKYNSSTYTFAGYDPPFRLFGRHNEVWIDLV